jgi:AcrR family transcriptional regulator
MAVFAGQGDSMGLLWGAEPERGGSAPGPKPGLSVDAIVAAAIEVADEQSAAGVSMRAVADRLGRSTMALYTYVPGKAELLDLMYDRAHAELTGEPADPAVGWRAAVTAWVEDLWAMYLRHPWVADVSYARPVLGPHEQAALEALLGALEPAALPARTRRGVVSALFHFVRGMARTAAEARRAAAETGTPDGDWWSARAGRLADVAPDFAARFPRSVRLGAEDPDHDADGAFRVGLAVLLDGVAANHG